MTSLTYDEWLGAGGAASSSFGGGSGASASDPIVLCEPAHFYKLAHDVECGTPYQSAYFRISADVDMGGAAWRPIGRYRGAFDKSSFSGYIIGGGHVIHNFSIDDRSGEGAALFGCLDGASIRDIKVGNFTIVGAADTGAIAAFAVGSRFINCHAGGTISASGASASVGGLVGTASACTFESCTAGSIINASGGASVGGIVGTARSKTSLDKCRSVRQVNASGCEDAGGAIGRLVDSEAVSTSAEAEVRATNCGSIGGFVGAQDGGVIKKCRATGGVVVRGGAGPRVGGFAGTSGGTIASCASGGDVDAIVPQADGAANIGGFAGVITAEVSGSAAFGKVSGEGVLGGFAATLLWDGSPARTRDCCCSGSVAVKGQESASTAGGFVGMTECGGGTVSMVRCYSFGALYGTTSGFVASNVRGVVSKCFWRKDDEVNASKGTSHAISTLTTAEFAEQDQFEREGWSFDSAGPVWSYTGAVSPPRPYPAEAPMIRIKEK